MELGITGKKAIVCASSRGLGSGCAMALAEAGCEVVVNGRNAKTTEQTAHKISNATGAIVHAVIADVSSAEGQQRLFDVCPEPDILVNNNGGPPRRDFRELSRDDMIEGVTQNMITPIELIQRAADGMAKKKFGRIVNITSLSVYTAIAGLDLSSGARAGLTAFLAGIARNYAADNVTINNILPGKMDTDRLRSGFAFAAKKSNLAVDQVRQNEIAGIPAKRFGNVEEFGNVCAFLCSVHAGYITGRNILIDGGLNANAF